jgi:hypothetical protein
MFKLLSLSLVKQSYIAICVFKLCFKNALTHVLVCNVLFTYDIDVLQMRTQFLRADILTPKSYILTVVFCDILPISNVFDYDVSFTPVQISRFQNKPQVLHRAMAQAVSPGLSQRRPGFEPESVHLRFMEEKVALVQVFLGVLRFSTVSIIPQWLSILVRHMEDERPICGRSSETWFHPINKNKCT